MTTMSLFLSLLLFHFLLFFFISNATELYQNYMNCPSYNCGDLLISYPFWQLDETTIATQFCGYQGFGINCSNVDRVVLQRPNDNYYVKGINYEYRNLTLVDGDAAITEECPRVRRSIDLTDLPLSFSASNVNLGFHYNCTDIPDFATVIPCLASGYNQSSVHILGNETKVFDWDRFCSKEVVTMVKDIAVGHGNRQVEEFYTALSRGFEMNWSVPNCGSCEESGGRCGYKYLSFQQLEVVCFCSDGRNTTANCKDRMSVEFTYG